MVGEPAVLVLTDSSVLPGSVVVWALQKFESKVDGGKALGVSTHATGGKLKYETSSAEVVVSVAAAAGFHSADWLKELSRVIKPGGVVLLVQEDASEAAKASLQRNLLLAGFVSVESADLPEALVPTSALPSFLLRAQKPTWETGSSFPLKKKTVSAQETVVTVPSKANGSAGQWKLPVFETDNDFDLVDEDDLLTEDDLKRPELPPADDCEVGQAGRKACKNCTCGRAELEEKGDLSDELLNNPKSACGNCGLGDAFRCSTCPYKGLPPFKVGEKITLSGTLLTADV